MWIGSNSSTRCGRVHFEHSHRKWLVITVRPTTSVRESPQKNLPPRNTPDSFCRCFTRQNPSLCCMGGIFLLRETHLENLISRPNVIPTFRQRRCTNRGRNFVRSKRRSTYTSSGTLYLFCALTIRKHLSKVNFERRGRGQEPSSGHKFSIFENFLSIRDFTSQTLASFDVILLG